MKWSSVSGNPVTKLEWILLENFGIRVDVSESNTLAVSALVAIAVIFAWVIFPRFGHR